MKRKLVLSLFLLTLLLLSIGISDLTKGILASDQLEAEVGNMVEGKLFLSTTGSADILMAYITLTAEKIFTPPDILHKLIQFQVIIKPVETYGYGPLTNVTENRLTFLVFYDNRTTLFLGEFYCENATEWVEMTVLHEPKLADMRNLDNRRISFSNGSSYLAGTLEHADPKYILLESLTSLSAMYLFYNAWTLFAISPTAHVSDDISYDPPYGVVMSTPAVITSEGDSYDAILVEYTDTRLFSIWEPAPIVDAWYEAASGLLIQIYEEYDASIWKFIPGTIDITLSAPFSTISIVFSIAVISLITTFVRKKK